LVEPFLRSRAQGDLPSLVVDLLGEAKPAAFFARANDRCVGFVSLWFDNLSLARSARIAFWLTERGDVALRKWIDTNLIERLLAYARGEKTQSLRVRVDGDDEGRRTALAASGFEPVDEVFRLERPLPRAEDTHTTPLTLTRAKLADIVELHNEAYAGDPDVARFDRKRARALDNPTNEIWLAKRGREALGFIEMGLTGGTYHGSIESLAVRPASRRMGVAVELVQWAMHRLALRGARAVSLQVRGSNQAAMRLYRKLGFRPVQSSPIWECQLVKPEPVG
jgi:ribosomal protein S18 acetylase RimI-like enzyme